MTFGNLLLKRLKSFIIYVLSSLANFYVLTNVNNQVAMIIIVLPYTRKCFLLSLKIHTYDSIIQGIASSTS